MAKDWNRLADIECKFFENSDDVPDPGDLDRTKKNLMIFDDLKLEKQNKYKEYYTMGQYSNTDGYYLAQNYFKIPKENHQGER